MSDVFFGGCAERREKDTDFKQNLPKDPRASPKDPKSSVSGAVTRKKQIRGPHLSLLRRSSSPGFVQRVSSGVFVQHGLGWWT